MSVNIASELGPIVTASRGAVVEFGVSAFLGTGILGMHSMGYLEQPLPTTHTVCIIVS